MIIVGVCCSGRYTSIADVIDISSITPSKVKTIDLRVFLALWCGVDVKASCGGTLCKTFAGEVLVWSEYETCVQMLNPMPSAESNCCVYGVEDDCTSTIWTNNPKLLKNARVELRKDRLRRRSSKVTAVDQTEPPKLLNVRRRAERILNERWKAEKVNTTKIELVDVRSSLGPNSAASISSVIAFGSMFSTVYKDVQSHIDITAPSGDKDLDDLIRSLKLLSFSSEIVTAGKAYIHEEIAQAGFFCAQLRLSDGQFKNHWNATFQNLKAQLTSYRANWTTSTPIFVMTDLPSENWTKTELNDLLLDPRNSYQVHKLHSRNDLIQMASRRILTAEAGFAVGSVSESVRGFRQHQEQPSVTADFKIPHVELAIEEVVCSCARLGFSGTRGSTIADSIRDLRAISTLICSTGLQSAGFET